MTELSERVLLMGLADMQKRVRHLELCNQYLLEELLEVLGLIDQMCSRHVVDETPVITPECHRFEPYEKGGHPYIYTWHIVGEGIDEWMVTGECPVCGKELGLMGEELGLMGEAA